MSAGVVFTLLTAAVDKWKKQEQPIFCLIATGAARSTYTYGSMRMFCIASSIGYDCVDST